LQLFSGIYFVFLGGLVLLYWPFFWRSRIAALALLLFANYFFYARWSLYFLALIPAVSSIDYAIGLGLQASGRDWVRRLLVTASLAMNLGLLAVLRELPRWNLALPLTLSFYVFQALTYTIDLYRRDIPGTKSYLAYLTAVSFFPTILAGPITRVCVLLDQMEKRSPLTPENGGRALFLIGMGLTKKLLIADYLAEQLINRVFDFPNLYSGTEVLLSVYGYALQLYYDFSGYTDIAIGSALLLGIQLPANFKQPYAAVNIADFWRRWHITLSTWLRDYLYFSLPGLRSKWKVLAYTNLVVTMAIGGLWHGPSWTFLVWGALHGFGLAGVRLWQAMRGKRTPQACARLASVVATFHFVALAWIFFRAPSVESAIAMLSRIGSGTVSFANVTGGYWMILAVAWVFHYLPERWYEAGLNLYVRAPFYAQAAALLALVLGLQRVAATGSAPFIYNRF
jgi:D-alanyl-lipoteichoic acid acyltransferase DltB (MBOAT superfamily)